jgi:type VI secretion system protein ImpE
MTVKGPAVALAEQSLVEGQLGRTLDLLQEQVRSRPEDAKLRVFLFQLFCILGKWPRALTQLQVLAGLDPESMMLARVFQPVIQCEVFREQVFAGKRTPLIFGDPAEWMGLLIQAAQGLAGGKWEAAGELRNRAFEAAPTTGGKLNDQPFEWIADADQRLGPLLEVIMEGRYYWVPFCRIKRIALEKPTDLRDLVWTPAQFVWTNGGEAAGHIPSSYPGTHASADDALRLCRKTEWRDPGADYSIGLGQRVLVTDQGDHALLDCRIIDLVTA